MTTSSIRSELDGSAICRVTVIGDDTSADLGLPPAVTMGSLLPVLAERVGRAGEADAGGYVLQRLGEEPLDPEGTPETLGLRDGDVLYLRPADDILPPMVFDDLADGVSTVIGSRTDRWRTELTRRLFVGLSCLPLLTAAVVVLVFVEGTLLTVQLGTAALAMLAGSVAVARSGAGDRAAVLVCGVAGWTYAALAGLTAYRGVTALSGPDRHDVLLAAACAVGAAALLLIAGNMPPRVFGVLLVLALAAELGSFLALSFDWDATVTLTVLAVTMFVLSAIAPRLALRMAGLRVPQLPRNADELQEDLEPGAQPDVERRVAAADTYLTVFTVAAALYYALDLVLLTRRSGWFDWFLALALASAVTLRSRGMTETWQRVSLALAGTLGLTLAVVWLLVHGGAVARTFLLVILLAAAGLLLLGARRLPTLRLLPIWGHVADIMEMTTAIALVPLLLQFMDVYWFFRSLAG
ncbi:hypothetical protein GCM10010377_69030 [Streptomyces viridiviolaceus]|uniref:Type VII secretion integral membrane protein EccD n=1 Tax=Streptomyces viridiviolaceus TaxID=68282 RepID=A0ABW2EA07_9ACTN|nr:type VII secretion integral membrane protein EccD [Streptomyces viridiviolaceus]GHB68401.1 hypothetical protein GCM10010377_69030 [Streptomyces viridiviolaceus]